MEALNITHEGRMSTHQGVSLGARVTRALEVHLANGARKILLVGPESDCRNVEAAMEAVLQRWTDTRLRKQTWCENEPKAAGGQGDGKAMMEFDPDVIVVCSDRRKDSVLSELNKLRWSRFPKLITFGTEHQDDIVRYVQDLETDVSEKSNATGYTFAKAHIYEVLRSVSSRHQRGLIVELGVFRGGTLLLIKEMLGRLNFSGAQLVGFDTFSGFPAPRCLLDMFAMEQFVNRDYDGTAKRLGEQGILLIRGDIVETAAWVRGKQILMTFVDTDNYSPVATALPMCWENTVSGGCIVFDHFYTKEAFLDTIGERVAGWEFFRERRDYLHLSGTGVFVKV